MDFHPIANLFPLLDDDALQSLAADIQEHGLYEPVWLYEGKIIDGRNRYRACELAGVEPRYQEYVGDTPLQFVISKNIQRRDMTSWQRAFVALEALPAYQAEAKKRMLAGVKGDPGQIFDEGRAMDIVAKVFHTNRMYVHAAARLKVAYPEHVEAACAGVFTYSDFIALKHEERAYQQQVRDELASPQDAGETSGETSGIAHMSLAATLIEAYRCYARKQGVTSEEIRDAVGAVFDYAMSHENGTIDDTS